MWKFIATALALALPLLAFAENEEQLVRDYTRFAGSQANAESLVSGLRDGEQIRLSADGRTTSFKPATDKLGYGNVKIALELTKASLAEQGIKNPTPEQIRGALDGVLEMRASGMGWGRIAQERGFKLGEVMRAERPHKIERAERPHRPERPERPERHHHRR
jgi:hypothetical protein